MSSQSNENFHNYYEGIQAIVAALGASGVSVYQDVGGKTYVNTEAFFSVCRSFIECRNETSRVRGELQQCQEAAQAHEGAKEVILREAAAKITKSKSDADRMKKSRNRWRFCTVVLVLVLSVAVYQQNFGFPVGTVYTAPSSTTKATTKHTTKATTKASTASITPVFFENGGIYIEPSGDCLCPLTVETPSDVSAYIYLDSLDNASNDMSFIVKAGESAKVFVPLGEYEIYYAMGETWYGTKRHFGDDTAYAKCDDLFDFTYEDGSYLGWRLELYLQYNGNLDTTSIPEYQFPG